jgi:hypothetical protein
LKVLDPSNPQYSNKKQLLDKVEDQLRKRIDKFNIEMSSYKKN